jgi:hypothetical protein
MPGFVRSKKDEANWQKAKEAASKSKNKEEGSFTDQDWALVNHIYQQMKKSYEDIKSSNDPKLIEDTIKLLEKARRRFSDEPVDPIEDDYEGEEGELGEGFREFDPDEEESSGEDWLRENDPEYGKGEGYEEYADDENEEDHQRGIAEDTGDLEEGQESMQPAMPAASAKRQQGSGSQGAPQASITEEDSPQEISGKRGRFRQPSKEELMSLRAYTRPWEQRARETARLQADPTKNPVLAHQGNIIEARNKAHAERKSAYQQLVSSDEYKNADPITQMEMDDKFESDWRSKNPEHLMSAMESHGAAHKEGKKGMELHAAAKDAKIRNILSGGTQSPEAVSVEEGLQHAGGVRGEEGTEGSIKSDPASSFAMGNQDFIKQYAKDYETKGKKPLNIDEMMDYNEGSKRDISRILGPAQSKDPKFEEFFSHYYPLIGMNAHRTIKKLGLDPKHPDIDMSMLHEAGMHGLIQAMNDYSHENPSKASFATHAANKIRGLQMTAMRNQDAIPAEVRQAQKKFASQGKIKKLLSETKHPKIADINDRIKRVESQKQVQAIRRPAGTKPTATALPKPPKINMPSGEEDVD